ncbi:MAG: hypothetical protein ACRDV7_07130, partial [Acidimicrobiia bacterium]
IQARHHEWVAGQAATGHLDPARRRARRVALTLMMEGESIDTVERALHRSGFHPAVGHEAVRWAQERRQAIDSDVHGDAASA